MYILFMVLESFFLLLSISQYKIIFFSMLGFANILFFMYFI